MISYLADLSRRIVHRVGFRGYFLLTLAFVDVLQGINFVDPVGAVQTESNRYLADAVAFSDATLSLWVWACAWWATAAVCLYSAFRKTYDHWGFIAAITLKVGYVAALVFATAAGMPDGLRRIALWLAIASAVWVISRLAEPSRPLAEINHEMEELERTGEIRTTGGDGDDA